MAKAFFSAQRAMIGQKTNRMGRLFPSVVQFVENGAGDGRRRQKEQKHDVQKPFQIIDRLS